MNKKIVILFVVIVVIVIGFFKFYKVPVTTMPTVSKTDITIENFAFNPSELTIKKGEIATWTNKDSMAHQISGSGFKSEVLNKGQNFSFKFETVGTFDYNCTIHPSMKGKIIVE